MKNVNSARDMDKFLKTEPELVKWLCTLYSLDEFKVYPVAEEVVSEDDEVEEEVPPPRYPTRVPTQVPTRGTDQPTHQPTHRP